MKLKNGPLPHRYYRLGKLMGRLAVVLLLVASFCCEQVEGQEKKKLVCSTTQVADFARQIVGDRWDVVCVLGHAQDPHTYEVCTDDSSKVASADLCAENGWNLEGNDWMKKLASDAGKPIVTCIEGVSPLSMNEGGKEFKDPHAWLSPKNAIIYVNNLFSAICKIDPDNTEEYQARKELYIRQLRMLDGWIKQTLSSIPANQKMLVTHHDAFGYFCKEFNFQHESPMGWTTADLAEVTAADRQVVVTKIRETGVKAIFVEKAVNEKMISGIARDAGVVIGGKLYSDAMGEDGTAAENYIGMMRENVLTMVRVLK